MLVVLWWYAIVTTIFAAIRSETFLSDFTASVDTVWNGICQSSKWIVDVGNELAQVGDKSSDNFENGYQHNDLQLGKLSLIGIYRGKVNFSERDSISSKFLDLMQDSFADSNSTDSKNEIMKLSHNEKEFNTFPFEFKHNKLRDTISLIDVIVLLTS